MFETRKHSPLALLSLLWCLLVFIIMIKLHKQKQFAEELISFMYTLQSIIFGSQGRKSRQEPGGRNWSRGHKEVLLSSLLSLMISACLFQQHRTTCPSVVLGTMNRTPLHQSSIKKKKTELLLQVNLVGEFSLLRFLLPKSIKLSGMLLFLLWFTCFCASEDTGVLLLAYTDTPYHYSLSDALP